MKTFKVTVDGQSYTVQVEEIAKELKQNSPGTADKPNGRTAATSSGQLPLQKNIHAANLPDQTPAPSIEGSFDVKAPMPGLIIEVKVTEGDTVKDGDVLLILEAMKMENELTSPRAGTVTQVLAKKGDTVNSGDPLIILS